MKRIIALVLSMIMMFGCVPVMAQTDTAQMEVALIAVKGKVDIPAELTEFDSSSYTTDGEVTYNFFWSDAEQTTTIDIGCDELGRIKSYHYYTDGMNVESESNRLSTVTQEQVIAYTDTFMAKLFPEAYVAEDDVLVCDVEEIYAYATSTGTRYNVPYKRMKDGVYVDGNVASASLVAYGDEMTVQSAFCDYDYDAQFETALHIPDFDYWDAYEENFPAELVYTKVYEQDGEYTKLVYGFKDDHAGYISVATGKVVEKDIDDDYRLYRENVAEDSVYMASKGEGLTKEEIAELDKVAGLKSADEIEKKIRNMTELKLENGMKLQKASVNKSDDEYSMTLDFYADGEDYDRELTVTVDAQTGEIKGLYNYSYNGYENKDATDAQKSKAENAMDAFVKKHAGDDYKICVGEEPEYNKMTARRTYTRHVNSIPVMGEYLSVSYDMSNDRIESYSNYINDKLTFESTDGILGDRAYEYLLKAAPLEKIYIKSGGAYILCYSANENHYVEIDAKTGEKFYPYEQEEEVQEYTDIADHWCKEAVEKLQEVGIALPGDTFNPESAITQEDLLRIFASGLNYSWYMTADTDRFYKEMYNMGILTKEERNETAPVTREDAFVYMIRFARLERVAKLSNIYAVEFKDQALITPERIGYVAILYGMGIVGGDESGVRPDDYITRAEAAVMLYKYLTAK